MLSGLVGVKLTPPMPDRAEPQEEAMIRDNRRTFAVIVVAAVIGVAAGGGTAATAAPSGAVPDETPSCQPFTKVQEVDDTGIRIARGYSVPF